MKKLHKRLVLDRETVHRLDRVRLGDAKAGFNYSTGDICHYTNTCNTSCTCP